MTGDDVLHERIREVFQFADFARICSCGNPEDFWPLVLEALEHHGPDDAGEFNGGPDLAWAGTHLFVLYVLDSWKLTEHGGAIYGAWLSESGKRLRLALRAVLASDDDWDDQETWWQHEFQMYPDGRVPGETASVGSWKP